MQLFTSSTCGPCKIVKAFASNNGIAIDEVSIDTQAGNELAFKQGIRTVPTLIVADVRYTKVADILNQLNK